MTGQLTTGIKKWILWKAVFLTLLLTRIVTAESLVRRAMLQQNRIPYEGERLSATWDENGEHATVTREYCDGQRHSRVEYLAPESVRGQVLINDGRYQWHRLPMHKVVFRSVAAVPHNSGDKWELLQKNYRIETRHRLEEISNLPSVEVVFHPRMAGKSLRRVWIDRKSGFIVKVERYHPDQKLAAVSHFLSLRLNTVPDKSLFEVHPQANEKLVERGPRRVIYSREDLSRVIPGLTPPPEKLPGNYVFESAAIVSGEVDDQRVVVHYSDGLSTFSLVQAQHPSFRFFAMPDKERFPSGHVRVYVRTKRNIPVARWYSENEQFTLIGDVSTDFIRAVASQLAAMAATSHCGESARTRLMWCAETVILVLLLISAFSLLMAYRRSLSSGPPPSKGTKS